MAFLLHIRLLLTRAQQACVAVTVCTTTEVHSSLSKRQPLTLPPAGQTLRRGHPTRWQPTRAKAVGANLPHPALVSLTSLCYLWSSAVMGSALGASPVIRPQRLQLRAIQPSLCSCEPFCSFPIMSSSASFSYSLT